MGVKDCINVTLKKNEVTIKIDIGAEHKNVIANLKKKLPELKKLYKEDKTPILVKGKILSTREKREIKALIQDSIEVEVKFEGNKALGLLLEYRKLTVEKYAHQKPSFIKDL